MSGFISALIKQRKDAKKAEPDTNGRLKEILAVINKYNYDEGITPEIVANILQDLGPTFVKIGQIASQQAEYIPADYCDALTKLRSNVVPMDAATVHAQIEKYLGKPTNELFASFDEKPLGAASIAQVHRAVLFDGTVVAVKVRRPGIVDTVARDFALIEKVLDQFVKGDVGGLDIKGMISELEHTSKVELDLTNEANNLDRFMANNAGRVGVQSPKCYRELTCEAILTEDFVSGNDVSDVAFLNTLSAEERVEDMTGTEYTGGVAVSGEVDLGARKGTYHGTNALIPTFDYRAVKDAPEPEDYMQMRFYYADGSEREALLYTDGRWEYIKEPGVGIWRAKLGTGSGDVADYTWWRELCIDMDFQATFMNPLETGETPTTHPDYNGGEKAVWIDWTIENSWTDELGMKGSWTGHSYNDYNFDHDTPEGYVPERANEVRWLFVKERTSHSYVGYWYEVGTGRKVSDSYENTYSVTAYDLVTGEKQTMDDSDSIGKCMEQYFGLSDEAAVME